MTPFTYIAAGSDWLRILPELILLATALIVLMADLFGAPGRKGWLAVVALLGVVAAAGSATALFARADAATAFYGMVSADRPAMFAALVMLFAVGLGLLYSPGYIERQGIVHEGEYYALLLFAALGMVLMASATSLMIIFVGLEVLSLALYILCAVITTRSRSQEAGMKYFILSSFASAFLLYGMALTYGSTGATSLDGIRAFVRGHSVQTSAGFGPLLLVGLGLMAVGFSFKVSAVPFQAWTPDVYVGAPTPVTAFMSVGTKVAAFLALARVFFFALPTLLGQWEPIFWAVAVLTMVGGNLLAVTQRDVKRMLAYSSVANAGYILIAVATGTQLAFASLLIYLACYAAMNLGAFGVVLALERNDGLGTTLDDFAGLARRRPGLAAMLFVFLVALAGIPPTVGFLGKYYVFYAALVGNHGELAIIGALTSVIGMFYYLRVIWAMYFSEASAPAAPAPIPGAGSAPRQPALATSVARTGGGVAVAEPAVARATVAAPASASARSAPARQAIPLGTWAALWIALLATVGLGIVPGGLVQSAVDAASVLFR